MLTRKSLKIIPDNHQATLLSCLVVARCVNSMVAIIWAPFGLSLIGSGQRPGCVYQRFEKMIIIFIRGSFEKTKPIFEWAKQVKCLFVKGI
jgi:hypothetical protein